MGGPLVLPRRGELYGILSRWWASAAFQSIIRRSTAGCKNRPPRLRSGYAGSAEYRARSVGASTLKREGKCPEETLHRQVKCLNTVIEADHGELMQLIRPVRGFKPLKNGSRHD